MQQALSQLENPDRLLLDEVSLTEERILFRIPITALSDILQVEDIKNYINK